MKKQHILPLLLISFGVLVFTGCPPKNKLKIEEKKSEETKVEDNNDLNASSNTVANPGIQISQDWSDVPALQMVHFGYDSAQLDDSSRNVLKKNVAVLKKLPSSVTIRVEGHCDDRGTIEYNIALGQRRATAVSTFYATSGIAKSRLKTISFGEERPLCTEATDSCWANNRRSTTKVRNDQAISVTPESLQ